MAVNIEQHINLTPSLIPTIRRAPGDTVLLSYDKEADALYISFGDEQDASDSELLDNDVIARYDRHDHVIGFTVLHASVGLDSRLAEAVRLSAAF